ncbi:hypothetical protein [Sphingomonas lacusdianchii]|uniref:hypothetical protein n=1 Tax=Sphingomonas lacusdianchii TaxID=2917992 RepID=UPI001F59E8B1|nr:hypothetical protein [Sphingomonas sp. JXJ CY 53]
MRLSGDHVAALAVVDRLLRRAQEPWWVIAGAAVALHAAEPVAVDDVDVLLAMCDVPLVADVPGLVRKGGAGNALFRSAFYASLPVGGIDVEFMAGFELCGAAGWQPVWPRSQVFVEVGGLAVPTPDRAELMTMLTAFGRPKDLQRVRLLEN